MFGHDSRALSNKMWATEIHPVTGLAQFPLGRVTRATMSSKWLTLTMILPQAKENHTETIVELMKHGIGGFSTHFSVKQNILQGVDYVLARNFFDNRVEEFLSDSFLSNAVGHICNKETGECSLDVALREEATEIVEGHIELIPKTMELLRRNPIVEKTKDTIKMVADKAMEVTYLKGQLEIFKEQLEIANNRIKILELEKSKLDGTIENLRMAEPVVREVEVEVIKESETSKRIIEELKAELEKRGVVANIAKVITDDEMPVVLEVNKPLADKFFKDIFRDSFIADGVESRNKINQEALKLAMAKDSSVNGNRVGRGSNGNVRVTII